MQELSCRLTLNGKGFIIIDIWLHQKPLQSLV